MKLAIYDMDKTITRIPSWMPWLLFYALHNAPWRLALLPLAVVPAAGFLLKLTDRKGLKEATQALLMGRRVQTARVERTAAAFAARFGAAQELPGALAQIAADRADGWRILIATASCGYYARHMAARWGVEEVIATANFTDGEFLTNRIDGENCYGGAKRAMLEEKFPQRAERIRFYSDHVSDLPALLWADEAVAANPSPPLRAEAQRRGWPICEWM
ncbi:MAG: HAD-IB family phosphatase [Sphingomonadaceae bacterium]